MFHLPVPPRLPHVTPSSGIFLIEQPMLPKWKRFENLVAELQRALSGDASVAQNERVRGKTGALRELDITIRQRVAQFEILIVVDCKDYKAPVDIKDVEAYGGLLEDVRAHKGAMVAAHGFTAAAKTLAEMKGIDLFRLLDTETVEWASYISVPALVRDLRLRWRAFAEGAGSNDEKSLPAETALYSADGEPQGTVRDMVAGLWKYGVIPEEPGEGSLRLAAGERVYLKDGEHFVEITLRIEAKTWYDWFLGDIPLTVMRGFSNEHTGRLRVERLETDWLRFEEVERTWKRAGPPDTLSIKPVITYYLKDAPAGDPDATRSLRITLSPSNEPPQAESPADS